MSVDLYETAESGDESSTLVAQSLSLLNQYRYQHGLQPLVLDPTASEGAHAKALVFAAAGGAGFGMGDLRMGGALPAGGIENFAIGPNMGHVQAQFATLQRTRENQLQPGLRFVGIGIVKRRGDYVVVQHFS